MKKGVIILLIILVGGYYIFNKNDESSSQIEEISEEAIKDNDSLISKKLKRKVTEHQIKILKGALKKETVESQSFKDFVDPSPKKKVTDPVFLKQTFETLLDCYKEGCGEEPDHQGYYNQAQTVAAMTINRLLEEGLENNNQTSPNWMNEEDLLELFSSENERTRDLSFKHLMRRGDAQTQINKIIDQTPNLDDYKVGSIFKNLSKHVNEQNSDIIIDSAIRIIEDPDKSPLGKDEVLLALGETKWTETQVKRLADASCPALKDEVNKNSTIYNINERIAKKSGISFNLEQHCQ